MKKKKSKVKVTINGKDGSKDIILIAIVSIFVLEAIAMALGFNGQLLRFSTTLIAGLAGLMINKNKAFEVIKNVRNGNGFKF